MDKKTAIYTVFLSRGYQRGAGRPAEPESFVSNQELLQRLKSECSGVKFIARDVTRDGTKPVSLVKELEELKAELDGVVLIGFGAGDRARDYRLALSGLPTIVVYNLFEFMNVPYKLFATGQEEESVLVGPQYEGGKVLTAELDRQSLSDPSVSSVAFKDLIYKIKLIQAIRKLKESRILVVSPHRVLATVDYQDDIRRHLPKGYDQTYTRALKESLGVELVPVLPEEFYQAYERTDEQEAKRIGEKWMAQAKKVEAATSEITKTARSYLAFEALREKYNCNAVSTHMRRLKPTRETKDMFWPGLGLECGFKTRGIQAVCQNYPNVLVAEMLGYFLTGRPSMLGDLIVDPANSVTILTHCGAPINPYGDERIVPYAIKTHAQSPVRDTQKPGSSTGLQVEWPSGEPVTFWKVYVLHSKIGLFTGEVVNARSVYGDRVDDILCRTKLVARVDAPRKIQRLFSPGEYGIHRAATLGDLRQALKDAAVLLGYEVMEEDR
ncbi:MAG: hypothetical protein U9Q78_02140 [Chloroflexota bacterium]|nr:hypothetical protein [Chloroflexota bacterium]